MHLIKPINPISFTYSSVLKDEYKRNPEMREHVKLGIYGGLLEQNNISLEHLKPHSRGGKNELSNFALATVKNNNARASKPLTQFLTKEMFENYIAQFMGWKAKEFNNKKYIEGITQTVKKLGLDLKG